MSRAYSGIDHLIQRFDHVLKTVAGGMVATPRVSPGEAQPLPVLRADEQKHVAGLMRVDHTGEVCAQALYQGQALTARLPDVRDSMQQAAVEEEDHLAWTEARLRELESRPSVLNPLWYGLSFAMGAAAGLAGDKWSLGFVAETERQVCRHLEGHLAELPRDDARSRAILQQMKQDEARHAISAERAGGADLPAPVRAGMTILARVMTTTAYRF